VNLRACCPRAAAHPPTRKTQPSTRSGAALLRRRRRGQTAAPPSATTNRPCAPTPRPGIDLAEGPKWTPRLHSDRPASGTPAAPTRSASLPWHIPSSRTYLSALRLVAARSKTGPQTRALRCAARVRARDKAGPKALTRHRTPSMLNPEHARRPARSTAKKAPRSRSNDYSDSSLPLEPCERPGAYFDGGRGFAGGDVLILHGFSTRREVVAGDGVRGGAG
jgi:hypothetical protein